MKSQIQNKFNFLVVAIVSMLLSSLLITLSEPVEAFAKTETIAINEKESYTYEVPDWIYTLPLNVDMQYSQVSRHDY